MPISVAIVEDIKQIAFDLKDLINLETDMVCTQVYLNAEDAIAFLSQSQVDVVLFDIGLPGKNGIDAVKTLKPNCPQTEFCMFTVFEDNERIFESLKAGANGFILKNSPPHYIINSLRELHQGGSPMHPEIARRVIEAFVVKSAPRAMKPLEELPLSGREYQLLELLSTGMIYKEIAMEMDIKVGTVKQHIHKIYHKLQVKNKTEAIKKVTS